MEKLKRVYVYEQTIKKIEEWAEEHDDELPWLRGRGTFPQKVNLYINQR